MLSVKGYFVLSSGLSLRTSRAKRRSNGIGRPSSRFKAGTHRRGCFGRVRSPEGEDSRDSHLKLVKERYEQLQRENGGRGMPASEPCELEMDYTFRAISERIPESKLQRFRDAVLCYGAVPRRGLLREAMLSLDEFFIARVRRDALRHYDWINESVIYANTFHMEDKEVEMIVALRKVKNIVDGARFSTKYPDTAFAKSFWSQVRDCNMDRPGTLRAIEYLKQFGAPFVPVNVVLPPEQLWYRFVDECRGRNNTLSEKLRTQRDDCVRRVLFHVLPLLLPKLPNSPSHLIVNWIGLPKAEEEKEEMIERAKEVFEMGKYPYYGQAFEKSCKGKENEVRDVDFRIMERNTDIGWLMHDLESLVSSHVMSRAADTLGMYPGRSGSKPFIHLSLAPLGLMRRLGAWRRYELAHPGSAVAAPFAEYTKGCSLYNDDRIAKWERLKKVAAIEGHREELKTSVPLLMQQWRDRLAEYRSSDLSKKQIEFEEEYQLNTDIDEPYVDPLSDLDDEKGVERIFSTILPRLLEAHPVTGNLVMKIKGDDPSSRDRL